MGFRQGIGAGRNGSHGIEGEHAAALQLPVLMLLQQHRAHQACDRGVVGEDADNAGAAFDELDWPSAPLGATFTRSSRLVLHSLRQWLAGKWRNASTSSRAVAMRSAALGNLAVSIAAT